MKKILLIIVFLLSTELYSQEDNRLRFYRIDGTEFILKEKEPVTVKYFEETYLPEYKFIYSHSNFELYNSQTRTGILSVCYLEFTDKPIYIIGNKPSEYQIKIALSSFNYNDYLKNWQFDYNLKKYIKEARLIIDDLYKIFGKPNEKIETSSMTVFMYKNLRLNFTIKDYKVIDFLHY